MLSLSHLRFAYGTTPVLMIPDFDLPAREHVLVQGRSGSGKTSLLFLLAGFLTPTEGTITLAGKNLAAMTPAARDAFRGETLGFVFQQPHLMAPLTVLENLLVANTMAGRRADKPKALKLLEALGLADLADRKPDQLSHGQMQRVAIARALMNTPKIVLADEPTSALDDEAAEAVITLLLETAAAYGAQVVVTSHDARIRPHFTTTLKLGEGN